VRGREPPIGTRDFVGANLKLYETELEDASRRLVARGRDKSEFSFQINFCPPDPDGAGMFTVQYEVTISDNKTSRSLIVMGGIGLRWVDRFENALEEGYFK
jgi:hypothetical protein